MSFELPKLQYNYDALEPYIDAKTMEIHYSRHHGAYTNNLNAALQGTGGENKAIEEILASVSKFSPAVRNNGGGYFNHILFWENLSPKGGGLPTGNLLDAINKSFSSLDKFKELFTTAALTRFGSGWAWLIQKTDGSLEVTSSPNQDNPLMDIAENKASKILLGLDVWEHAYYLKYQNRRPEYVEAFWNVVNWDEVSKRLKK
ncbi:MAG: superoxide dismutase [Bacteroidales bacterium]|nr:superoxide dismutase [Bacteroidales bacterium]